MATFFLVVVISITAAAVLFLIVEVSAIFWGEWYGAPFVRSSKRRIRLMLDLAGIFSGKLVYDLGSGDGSVIIEAAKRGAKAVGIEINPFLVWYSRWRIKRLRLGEKTSIIKKDFRIHNFSDADVLFIYLWPETIRGLEEKFFKELKPGARVISNGFPISGMTPIIEKDNIFVYERK